MLPTNLTLQQSRMLAQLHELLLPVTAADWRKTVKAEGAADALKKLRDEASGVICDNDSCAHRSCGNRRFVVLLIDLQLKAEARRTGGGA